MGSRNIIMDMLKYDGTQESFNHIVQRCFPPPFYKVYFIDEYGDLSHQLSDYFIVYPMRFLYKKGDRIPAEKNLKTNEHL